MTMDNFVEDFLNDKNNKLTEIELINKESEETSSEELAILKKVNSEFGTRFYAKIHSDTNRLFNIISDNLEDFDKRYKGSKISMFKFQEINKVTYSLYKEYIETKNSYLYNQANKHKFI